MVLTVTTFKELYNIELDDIKVMNAIQTSLEYFYNLISKRTEFKLGNLKLTENIRLSYWYPLSKDLSIVLKRQDIEIFEYDSDWNKVDLNDKITNIEFVEIKDDNVLKLTFSETLPTTSGKQVILRFNTSRLNCFNPDKIDNIRRFVALKTFNLLSKDIILALNQNGISDWNLNGVSVSANNSGIEELKKANELEMAQIYNTIMPLAIERTISKGIWLGSTRF